MKVVMSPSAASISTSGRSNFSEACLWNPSREALNKADLGSARVTLIIRATSAMKAEQESRKSLRRATKLFLTSSSTISWTRENSAMRVPANVLSSSRICPKPIEEYRRLREQAASKPWIGVGGHGPGPGWSGPFAGSVPCWEWPQLYQLHYRSCLRVTPPSQLALRRPAPVVTYTPLWLKGTQCPTQWSSGPEMEHKD